MENYLGPLYGTGGSSNYYGYSNPAFDSLVKEGSAAATPDEAINKYQQAEDILAKDMPVHPAALRRRTSSVTPRRSRTSRSTSSERSTCPRSKSPAD